MRGAPGAPRLQDELLRSFSEAGIYDLAEDMGMIQNGQLSELGLGGLGAAGAAPGAPLPGASLLNVGAVAGAPAEAPPGPVAGGAGGAGAGQAASAVQPQAASPRAAGAGRAASSRSRARQAQAQAQAAVAQVASPPQRARGGGVATRGGGAGAAPSDASALSPAPKKKRSGGRSGGGEKANKGLRHFSMKVCEKVESKRRTSYNEVADELVKEFKQGEGPEFQCLTAYDEKNIRRRVYDALNVLMAMNIISKEKKEISWMGLPTSAESSLEHLQGEKLRCSSRIAKKKAYLAELFEHKRALDALVARNAQLEARGQGAGQGGAEVSLPFILLQTKPTAVIEVEMSEDNMLMHFDFNDTPFEVKDEAYVLQNLLAAPPPPPAGAL